MTLEPIESHLRRGERLDAEANPIIGGWPLTVEDLLRNADATRRCYSWTGEPFVVVSAEVTVTGWDVDRILSGSRLPTLRSHAAAVVGDVSGFPDRTIEELHHTGPLSTRQSERVTPRATK